MSVLLAVFAPGNTHSSTRGRSAAGGNATNAVIATNNSRRTGISAIPSASTSSLRGGTPTVTTRRDSMGIGLGGNIRRSQQLAASSSQAHMRSIDLSAQRSRPQTARSRMTQGLSGSSLKEATQQALHQNSPSIYSAGLANDSRISLLSMIAPRGEDLHHDELPQRGSTENTRLSLGPTVKSTKSSRALSGDHSVSPEAGRPRSKTQSSEPTAEQLHLDETELTGFCFSFRDYVSNRVHLVCDRQMGFATAARHMGTRAATSQSRLGHVTQLSKHEQSSVSVLKSLQRQAEKSYELVQDILRDLERLDAMLPANDKFFGADSVAPREFPCLSKMLVQRRRHSLPVSPSPHSSVVLRRQIAAKKAGIPAFPARTTSLASIHGRPLSAIPAAETGKPRPGPYQLPGIIRHAGANMTSRLHSKCSTDTRVLRNRGSRGSMTGSESANASAPVSPVTVSEPRLSFDGEPISPSETARISSLTAHGCNGNEQRSAYKRITQPFGGLRRPNSVASAYLDSGKTNSYSRSEVSLSREQVVWSPQIAFGASDSAFGFPSFDGASLSPQLALSDVGDEYAEGALDDNHCNIDMVLCTGLDHASLMPVPLKAACNGLHGHPLSSAASGDFEHLRSVHHAKGVSVEDKSPISSLGRASSRASVEYAQHHHHNAVTSPNSTKSLKLPPLHRGGSMASTTSPRSLPRGLSLRSTSSLASSPSASSMVSPTTPLGSPSVHGAANSLSIITMPDMSPVIGRQAMLSPQFPSEATRMLKRVIMEKPRKGSAETSPLASRPASQTLTSGRLRQALLPAGAEADDGHDTASVVSEMKAAFSYGTRSRASSVAHSLASALEESDAGGLLHTASPSKSHTEAAHASDSARGFSPTARTNPERMSTWSSSSARTLSEGLSGIRVPSADDSRTTKQPLPSAALSSLAASAAMINPPLASNETAGKGLSSIATSNVASVCFPRTRPVADLGLSIRSDLERRVRSFSASEGDPSLAGGARPHSSMGFHNPTSGSRSPLWSVRPSSYRTRRHSPHSASMRGFRPDSHRLSVVSTDSNSNCQTSRFASTHHDLVDPQSDAVSVGSYSSQATEMLHPSPPVSASQLRDAATSAATTITGKRRAQTMDLQPFSAL
ncbi:hypothetical protein GGH94_002704 [Coemansia aciculifera]|uniref:BLOC-1-related complex subunit 5 n=1 Tax=Coemansia aciculifera TaxID=417176 RepID=A0A9W8ILJ0_9FUNG|nr:hypothetical protein GGH94_002704 [Coemansia aciculifera]